MNYFCVFNKSTNSDVQTHRAERAFEYFTIHMCNSKQGYACDERDLLNLQSGFTPTVKRVGHCSKYPIIQLVYTFLIGALMASSAKYTLLLGFAS